MGCGNAQHEVKLAASHAHRTQAFFGVTQFLPRIDPRLAHIALCESADYAIGQGDKAFLARTTEPDRHTVGGAHPPQLAQEGLPHRLFEHARMERHEELSLAEIRDTHTIALLPPKWEVHPSRGAVSGGKT